MAKFQAMMDMLNLVVPFIERDEKGQLVRDQSIAFNPGIRTRDKVFPASISTSDESILNYLRAYGGNKANGGTSFLELVEKKTEVKKAPQPEAIQADKEQEDGDFILPDDVDEIQAESSYPEATTVQAASAILKGLYPELKSRDTNTKEKVLEVATDKGISFPNLD